MTYKEKLLDPRWQKKRLQIFNRDKFKCVTCGNDKLTLHIHHLRYYGNPWEAKNSYLQTLCERCHEKTHNIPDSNIQVTSPVNKIYIYFDDIPLDNTVEYMVKWEHKELVKWENATEKDWSDWNFPFSRAHWIDYLKTSFNNVCFKHGYLAKRKNIIFGVNYYENK